MKRGGFYLEPPRFLYRLVLVLLVHVGRTPYVSLLRNRDRNFGKPLGNCSTSWPHPPGWAKVAVIYEVGSAKINTRTEQKINKQAKMREFLANLPIDTDGGLSREEIRDRVDEERRSWDD